MLKSFSDLLRLTKTTLITGTALLLFLLLPLFLNPGHASESAPFFNTTLTDLDGKPVALEKYRGKPLMVNFWARWCGPCRTEIPELNKISRQYEKQGLIVLGIAIEDQVESVKDFAKAYEMNYPVLLAKEKGIPLMEALGNKRAGLPFTILIDRNGNMSPQKLGVLTPAQLQTAAETLLAPQK